ncbi:hypothetical protein B1218_36920, partial [Pseudomonas ogarae]
MVGVALATQESSDAIGLGCRATPRGTLIAHLLGGWRGRPRGHLPGLLRLARSVARVHGARPSCRSGLAEDVQ